MLRREGRVLASLCRGLLLSLTLAGCRAGAPTPPAEPEPGVGVMRAGAAKVDITPLPGVPLGGHSIESGTGYGVWTRLWARAIYLEDAHGEPLVLVVADLWSVPAGMADAVIERLHTHHGVRNIGRAQLLLSATHTHHSPGNFSSSRLYNRAASHAMGFDPQLYAFLVDRIAAAVAASARTRAPARLRLHTTRVDRLARNRSLAPFAANPEAARIVEHDARLPQCPDAPTDAGVDIDPCQAVDPTLTILRIEELDGRPRALAAFFAVHATSMRNATDAYNGDLFAVATAHAEAELARMRPELGDAVVALFNGAEGDVSPNWTTQGRAAALELGGRLADAIVATGLARAGRGLGIDGEIHSAMIQTPLADQVVEGPPAARTSKRALAGAAELGGAEDGRTSFHRRLPEGQTVQRHRRAGQGPKRPAIPPALFTFIFPRSTIPQVAPLSIHRVGPLTFVGLPGEFSTVMGMRVRLAVAASSRPGAPRPVTVGLAGDYLSYFVTPEEYAHQHYEGASMFWGQYAGTLLAERLAALAASVAVGDPSRSDSQPPAAVHDPGVHHQFTLAPGPRAARALRSLDHRLHEQLAITTPIEQLVRLAFDSAPPSFTGSTWPRVSVEQQLGDGRWVALERDGVPVDERGTEFVMFPREVARERWRWEIWWLGERPEGSALRLHAWGVDGSEHCTATLTAGTEPAPLDLPCRRYDPPPPDPTRGLGVVPAR